MGVRSGVPKVFLLLVLLPAFMGCSESAEVRRLEEKVKALEAELEIERAMAETHRLRAEHAEQMKDMAYSRADAAETMLEKGRRVSALLRSIHVELGDVLKELKRSYCSARSADEKVALWKRIRRQIDAFGDAAPRDGASQATFLAVEGWLAHLARRDDLAVKSFARAGKADSDVPYAHLFQAVMALTETLEGAPIPSLDPGPDGFSFTWILFHTEDMKAGAERVRKHVGEAKKCTIWGESSSHDILAVLHGLEAALTGDTHEIESAMTQGLSLPELDMVREELLLARAQARLYGCDLPGATADVEQVLRTLPGCTSALFLLGALHFYRGVNELESGGDGSGFMDKAMSVLSSLAAEDTGGWRAASALAMIQDITGDHEAAVKNLEAAIPKAGCYAETLNKYMTQVKGR
ncbi:MAG: hypothetical protein ACYTFG_03895 [Planctomycetota bacterium]|jgi:hypothetical protein